jgi:copper homeostasis protein (lipoprotein)
VQPQARYVLRATLHRDGRLFATTDTVHPVLTGGTAEPVEVAMRLVPTGESRPLTAHGLALPASFTGTLPCADCAGVRHHLDLWPDQVYQLSREWLGRSEDALRRDELGSWCADPGRGAIVLHGASEMPLFWQVLAPDRLRQMDMAGAPIVSDLDYDLVSDSRFAPTDLERLFLAGEVLIGADGPGFRECLTGRVMGIGTDVDYLALATAVTAERASPDTPLLVNVEGRITQPHAGLAPQFPRLTVLRFNAAYPGESCTHPQPAADLTNTYWRIDSLMGEPVPRLPNIREPHLILHDSSGSYVATVGCNRLGGSHEHDEGALTLTAGGTTLMACPPPLDEAERRLLAVLQAARAYRIDWRSITLLDGDGATIASLEAVYLR